MFIERTECGKGGSFEILLLFCRYGAEQGQVLGFVRAILEHWVPKNCEEFIGFLNN
jgi:hypothetical protein